MVPERLYNLLDRLTTDLESVPDADLPDAAAAKLRALSEDDREAVNEWLANYLTVKTKLARRLRGLRGNPCKRLDGL